MHNKNAKRHLKNIDDLMPPTKIWQLRLFSQKEFIFCFAKTQNTNIYFLYIRTSYILQHIKKILLSFIFALNFTNSKLPYRKSLDHYTPVHIRYHSYLSWQNIIYNNHHRLCVLFNSTEFAPITCKRNDALCSARFCAFVLLCSRIG